MIEAAMFVCLVIVSLALVVSRRQIRHLLKTNEELFCKGIELKRLVLALTEELKKRPEVMWHE